MNIGNILKAFDINFDYENVKIIRHVIKEDSELELIRNGMFDVYQSIQRNPVFNGCDAIISFLVDEYSKKTIFKGIYEVKGKKKYELTDVVKECSDVWKPDGKRIFYTLEKTKYLESLTDRLVIDWGGGERKWHQWYIKKKEKGEKGEKKIVEILPKGFFTRFPGFLDFSLKWHDLEQIIKNEEAHQDWYHALSKVKGVYLITDETDGKQYIGSAYNEKGIWGRWKNYIETKDGGNKKLIEILKANPEKYNSFRFSILEILLYSSTKDDVIHREKRAKEKLGTRSFGLNLN
ncbi:MAG: GIY-YIG nuclease family protein [Candidatus Methanoperedens sp.]|nr:GIY-YIG nuclease family protein [Candidatus Methanoperedens sp.]MCZ7394981.1 GIY-YIG nuclease family protein [Candidatus Methanoperedens sp.]